MNPDDADELLYGDGESIDLALDPPVPDGIGRAGWANRKAAAKREKLEFFQALFDAEAERLRERSEEVLGRIRSEAEWFERMVEGWHRAAYAADKVNGNSTVGKTVKFPSGPASELRASQLKTEIFDEDAMRAWLVDNTLDVQVYPVKEPELSRRALKSVVTAANKDGAEPGELLAAVDAETGESVPGVRFRAVQDRWQKGKS